MGEDVVSRWSIEYPSILDFLGGQGGRLHKAIREVKAIQEVGIIQAVHGVLTPNRAHPRSVLGLQGGELVAWLAWRQCKTARASLKNTEVNIQEQEKVPFVGAEQEASETSGRGEQSVPAGCRTRVLWGCLGFSTRVLCVSRFLAPGCHAVEHGRMTERMVITQAVKSFLHWESVLSCSQSQHLGLV